MELTSRERVLAALRREALDRVPYCELGVEGGVARQLGMEEPSLPGGIELAKGHKADPNEHTVEEMWAVASLLEDGQPVLRAAGARLRAYPKNPNRRTTVRRWTVVQRFARGYSDRH